MISNTAATLTGGNTLTYDFTGGGAYGTNAMANLGGTPAKYGMWAGDAVGMVRYRIVIRILIGKFR